MRGGLFGQDHTCLLMDSSVPSVYYITRPRPFYPFWTYYLLVRRSPTLPSLLCYPPVLLLFLFFWGLGWSKAQCLVGQGVKHDMVVTCHTPRFPLPLYCYPRWITSLPTQVPRAWTRQGREPTCPLDRWMVVGVTVGSEPQMTGYWATPTTPDNLLPPPHHPCSSWNQLLLLPSTPPATPIGRGAERLKRQRQATAGQNLLGGERGGAGETYPQVTHLPTGWRQILCSSTRLVWYWDHHPTRQAGWRTDRQTVTGLPPFYLYRFCVSQL